MKPAELAFYSKATTDVEYDFPTLGWGEILGVADRTDYDLKRHHGLFQSRI
jgi:glycyl-tRNA synthetase